MTFDPRIETLASYRAGEFKIACLRCRRAAPVDRYELLRRYGDVPLIEAARRVAAGKGCALARLPGVECSVQVEELPIWTWGRLRDARDGNWQAELFCRRRYAALKRTKSCPGSYALDLDTMIVALGDDYPLEELHRKARCPMCQTEVVDIEWHRAPPPKTPAPIQQLPEPPLRMRATGTALARQRFGVIEGN